MSWNVTGKKQNRHGLMILPGALDVFIPGKNKAVSVDSISHTSYIMDEPFFPRPAGPTSPLNPSHYDLGLVMCLANWMLNPAYLPHPVMSHIIQKVTGYKCIFQS